MFQKKLIITTVLFFLCVLFMQGNINAMEIFSEFENINFNCSSGASANLGENDGNISISIIGGSPPYNVEVIDEFGNALNYYFDIEGVFSILDKAAGSYLLNVTDSEDNSANCETVIATFNENITTICSGSCLDIGVEDIGFCYFWSQNYGFNNPNSSIQEVCPLETTMYTLFITDGNGYIVEEKEYYVNVLLPEVKINPNPVIICNSTPVILTVESDFTSYAWSNGDAQKDIIVNTSGVYTVTVTNENGCQASSTVKVMDESDPNQIEDFLIESGFVEFFGLIEIGGPVMIPANNNDTKLKEGVLNDMIIDFAEIMIISGGNSINIEENLIPDITNLHSLGFEPLVYITKNSNICEGTYDEALLTLESHTPNLGYHIHILEDGTGSDKLFIKLYGDYCKDISGLYIPKNNFVKPIATIGFENLVNNVLAAENELISNGEINNVFDRIWMLRGIFYGTEWSVDHSVENSPVRDAMFNKYSHGLTAGPPGDPRPFLSSNLFDELFESAEVKDGSRGVDFGHLIIGVDARTGPFANVNVPLHGGTGPEIVTWLGDLGGGAGQLAIKRITNPNKRAIDHFKGSSFGGWINLEGDVAAFLVARKDPTPFTFPLYPDLEPDDMFAFALEEYLITAIDTDIESTIWYNRSKIFVEEFLNGEIVDGEIANRTEVVQDLADMFIEFGENYMVNRLRQNGSLDVDRAVQASSHLVGASTEIAEIFVNTLERSLGSPLKRIKASGPGPAPTPQGTPFAKYQNLQSIQERIDELEDWLGW